MTAEVSLQTIRHAQQAISGTTMRTPLVRSDMLSALTGGDVFVTWHLIGLCLEWR